MFRSASKTILCDSPPANVRGCKRCAVVSKKQRDAAKVAQSVVSRSLIGIDRLASCCEPSAEVSQPVCCQAKRHRDYCISYFAVRLKIQLLLPLAGKITPKGRMRPVSAVKSFRCNAQATERSPVPLRMAPLFRFCLRQSLRVDSACLALTRCQVQWLSAITVSQALPPIPRASTLITIK